MSNKDDNKNVKKDTWLSVVKDALNKEISTDFGKVNLSFTVLLAIFCIVYASQGPLVEIFLLISNTIKTYILKQDIHHTYESVNTISVLMPIIILMILCLGYIGFHENSKKKIKKKINTKNE